MSNEEGFPTGLVIILALIGTLAATGGMVAYLASQMPH